jgi:hypothetical protein
VSSPQVQEEMKVDFSEFYRHAVEKEIECNTESKGKKGDKYVIEDINLLGVTI